MLSEKDPNGLDPNQPGAKLDDGKIRLGMVLGGFKRALREVGKVGTFGAKKYSDNGWLEVPNGQERYKDALLRHLFYDGSSVDKDSGLSHLAHAAWNALAILELHLRDIDQQTDEFIEEYRESMERNKRKRLRDPFRKYTAKI